MSVKTALQTWKTTIEPQRRGHSDGEPGAKSEAQGGIREGVNVMTRSLKVGIHKAVDAFGRSSTSYNNGCWQRSEARLGFNVVASAIKDWINKPISKTAKHNHDSAEQFLFGETEALKAQREMICYCAGVHQDSLVRFVKALKAEVERLDDSKAIAAAG